MPSCPEDTADSPPTPPLAAAVTPSRRRETSQSPPPFPKRQNTTEEPDTPIAETAAEPSSTAVPLAETVSPLPPPIAASDSESFSDSDDPYTEAVAVPTAVPITNPFTTTADEMADQAAIIQQLREQIARLEDRQAPPSDLHLSAATRTYSGAPREDLTKWCRDIAMELRGHPEWTGPQKVFVVSMKLAGAAREWYQDHLDAVDKGEEDAPAEYATWPELKAALETRFRPLDQIDDIIAKLNNAKQGSRSIAEFARELQQWFARCARLNLSYEYKKVVFLNGLRDQRIPTAIMSSSTQITNFEDLLAAATYQDNVLARYPNNNNNNHNYRRQPYQPPPPPRQPRQPPRNDGVAPMVQQVVT